MKILFKYKTKEKLFAIADSLIENTNEIIKKNYQDLDESFMVILKEVVKDSIASSLNLLLDQCEKYFVEFDLADVVSMAYERSIPLVKEAISKKED